MKAVESTSTVYACLKELRGVVLALMNPSNTTICTCLVGLFLLIAAGILLPRLGGSHRSPVVLQRYQLNNVVAGCTAYSFEYEQPPASLWDLNHNPKQIQFMAWGKSGTNDVWGHPLHFTALDPALGYGSVTSYGRDGRVGVTGLDADIEVHFGERQKVSR
jgi:hypothetical protein